MPRVRSLLAPLVILLALAGASRAGAEASLTLEQALQSVEQTNITALLAREAISQAIAQSVQQRAGLLPGVTLDAEQRRSRSVQVSSSGNVSRGGVTNRFDGGLSARLNTLDPSQIATYRAARIAVDVSRLDYRQAVQAALESVAGEYFRHLRNIARTAVLDANIARAEVLLQLARNQLDAGVATQIDVTRAEALLAQAQQARLQQDTVVYTSELQLKRLLALEVAGRLQLEPFPVRRTAAGDYAVALEETAFERRADVLRAQRVLSQNELEVRAAKFERLPSVSLFGTYDLASEYAFDGDEENAWSAGVSLSMPIFDGGRTRSLQRLALARQRSQQLRLQDLTTLVRTEVRLAVQDANSRLAQIAVAEKNRSLSEEELRLARVRFEQGVADNREIVDAQSNLAAAEDNLVEATYQYHLSRLELARARGEVRDILQERAE